ncbi:MULTISPECIES: hypothetical protein [unclassified Leptospira]|uniref:LIC_13246 family protein n=1 Tax=unclassified Leptospira TaxID=2633828 RepID=UPI0002BE80FE|nr:MULTISPECIES: hypothetical protein [unclassified Leptospira]EMK01225.1 hypothetical protein LEP1GSC192_1175 [Leptospira sp. B5-022]MCR1795451.1 hypothetical protein [Leptospira sp. id769339]
MTEIQNQKDKWLQINEDGLKIFNDILRSLIAFHEMIHGNIQAVDKTWIFKVRLVESNNPLVVIKKFGDYEYLVFAKIKSSNPKDYNSWIHIDGIQMERMELEKSEITKHEVFEILNMTDIYRMHCEPYSGEIPEDV